MASDPWLSVLMPVYNGAATLARSLNSVAEQAEGVETILVDQASTDESVAVAEGFRSRMELTLVSAPQNRNWTQNVNLALARAAAPVAAILHQDDYWLPGRAAGLRDLIAAAPDAALWLSAARYVDARGRRIGRIGPAFGGRRARIAPRDALERMIVQNAVAVPAAAFPTAAARAVGGLDETLWYTADWDFWLKLAARGPVGWRPEEDVAFRLHCGSLTMAGSRDLDDFAAQLDRPLRRVAASPTPLVSERALRLAEASNEVNVCLAARYHGARRPIGPVIARILALGPAGWAAFLRDARLVQRIWPRLRTLAPTRSG